MKYSVECDGDGSIVECASIVEAWTEVMKWAKNDVELDGESPAPKEGRPSDIAKVSIIPLNDDGNYIEDELEYKEIDIRKLQNG